MKWVFLVLVVANVALYLLVSGHQTYNAAPVVGGETDINVEGMELVRERQAGRINEKVFEIFRELKILTERLQAYFAEGMQNNVADEAIQASDNIGEKTAEVAEETVAEEP